MKNSKTCGNCRFFEETEHACSGNGMCVAPLPMVAAIYSLVESTKHADSCSMWKPSDLPDAPRDVLEITAQHVHGNCDCCGCYDGLKAKVRFPDGRILETYGDLHLAGGEYDEERLLQRIIENELGIDVEWNWEDSHVDPDPE